MKVLVDGKPREISSVFDNVGQDVTSAFFKKMIETVTKYNQKKDNMFILKHITHGVPPSEVMNDITFDKNQYSMSEEAFRWWETYALKHNEVSALEEKLIPNIKDKYDMNDKNGYFFSMLNFSSVNINEFVNYRCKWLRNYAKTEKIDISNIKEVPNLPEKSVNSLWKEKTGLINENTEKMEEKTMAKAKYTDKQVAVFQKFIRAGYSIEDVKNPELNEKQLKELYLGRKAGIDISLYCSPKISAEEMKELRKTAAAGIDLKEIAQAVVKTGDYNKEQTLQILDAAKHGVSFKNMLNPELDHMQMREIKLGERYGIDTSVYATADFSAEQMQKLRLELTVQKVIESIKSYFKERWERIIEWAGHKKLTPETAEEIKEIVSVQSPNSVADRLISESTLSFIAARVYDQVAAKILESEKSIENETVQSTAELAEEVSADIVQEQQEIEEKNSNEQPQSETMVETSMGKMPLKEYQEMTAYQKGYDSYENMCKAEAGVNEEIPVGNPPPEEEYFEADEYLG